MHSNSKSCLTATATATATAKSNRRRRRRRYRCRLVMRKQQQQNGSASDVIYRKADSKKRRSDSTFFGATLECNTPTLTHTHTARHAPPTPPLNHSDFVIQCV